MSWDASFYVRADGHLVPYNDWNYTHNTNRMINTALGQERMAATTIPWWEKIRTTSPENPGSWWELLDGASGEEGASLLGVIVDGLNTDPDRFRAMDPDNGWGDFDQLREILEQMRDVSKDFPSGEWRVSG
jgi:hypothetical protein